MPAKSLKTTQVLQPVALAEIQNTYQSRTNFDNKLYNSKPSQINAQLLQPCQLTQKSPIRHNSSRQKNSRSPTPGDTVTKGQGHDIVQAGLMRMQQETPLKHSASTSTMMTHRFTPTSAYQQPTQPRKSAAAVQWQAVSLCQTKRAGLQNKYSVGGASGYFTPVK